MVAACARAKAGYHQVHTLATTSSERLAMVLCCLFFVQLMCSLASLFPYSVRVINTGMTLIAVSRK